MAVNFFLRRPWFSVIAACAFFALLWIPGLFFYAPFADTADYALLGKSLWHGHGYAIFGEPYGKQLPLHAFLSYPFVFLFGYHIGMQVATLTAGFFVLLCTFRLLRRCFSDRVAVLGVFLLALHHGFVLLSMQGGSDLLFTALFLASLERFLAAKENVRQYAWSGLFLGLALLTRFNALPVLPFYLLVVLISRRAHLKSLWLWFGALIPSGMFLPWQLRNAIVIDDTGSGYGDEIARVFDAPVSLFIGNILHYLNPLNNLLPVLFLLAIVGLVLQGRRQWILAGAMLSVWIISSIWWVHGIRFFFPGYPILMGFAVVGFLYVADRFRMKIAVAFLTLIILMDLGALCLYTNGACNAWFDRTVGIIPPSLGLTSEGMYSEALARRFINEHAESGATVIVEAPTYEVVWDGTIFREDLHLTTENACPAYRITTTPKEDETIIFTTESAPRTSVVISVCD